MSEKNKSKPLSFARLALALANDYSRLFVIDSKNDSYIEYAPSGTEKELVRVSEGRDFFTDVHRDTREQVWIEDQDNFLNAFQKENITKALEDGQSFSLNYRLNINESPRYFFLKAIRADDRSIIIGVQDVDVQKRRELEAEQATRTYSEIARSLASLFEIIYHVNIETGSYILYSSTESFDKLNLGREDDDFFESAEHDMKRVIHPDDVERVMNELQRDNLIKHLHATGSLSITYRQLMEGSPQYMNLVAFVQEESADKSEHIVIGVRNIDQQVRREMSIRAESQTFSDISLALAQRYEVIYHVNIITNEYTEYSASEKYAKLKVGTKGKDFFVETQQNMKRDIYQEDLPMMMMSMQKDNLLNSLATFGKTILNYRLMLDGRAQYVSLYAVRPKEDSEHIIVAVANVDAAKRMELAYQNAMDMANKDALTGIKNKRAYVQAETDLDELISNNSQPEFAVVVCDMNGLKRVNDTQGHKAGDDFIRTACSIICNTFKHSPVFRIGGDEFAVILRGQDYENRASLMETLHITLCEHKHDGIPVLASGISVFDPDNDMRVQDVFERADTLMYADKEICKSRH